MRTHAALALARIPLRMPFTLATLAALVMRAWRTDTITAALPHHVVARVGFAPRDLLDLGWQRIFSSAMFTHGPVEFWAAVLMIVFAVGLCEWAGGSVLAGLTFWGVHIITLLAESLLVALPQLFLGSHAAAHIARLRDVGPSAGYVGALGLLCALLPSRWRYAAAAVVLLGLAYTALAPDPDGLSTAARSSAAIAHFIAFPLGWCSLLLWRHFRTRQRVALPLPSAARIAATAAFVKATLAGYASRITHDAPAFTSWMRRLARPSS